MKRNFYLAAAFAAALMASPVLAASSHPAAPPPPASQAKSAEAPHDMQSITHGSVSVEGQSIDYKAITGILVIDNGKGQPYTSMSFVAYVKQGVEDQANRPITFFYNGGPGSSTVWLHMLAWGPQLVKVGNATLTPPAPYAMVNNDYSLLDATDMVFIDMPGTGFGRIIGKQEGGVGTTKMVWGIDEDAKAFTRFITRYLGKYGRWKSPKYLFGESYGTTRSAVLSLDLLKAGVGLNGVMLLSAILNYDISVDSPKSNPGVNISYATGLPSYAATAWYHNELPGKRPADLKAFLEKVEQFAMTDYLTALNKGYTISRAEKKQIAQKMHAFTGLPVGYIMEANLKVTGGQFAHKLLDEKDDITGRLDSRYSGPALDPLAESGRYDPLNSAIGPPTIAMFNAYVRNALDFGKGMHYRPSVYRRIWGKAGGWDFTHRGRGVPNVMPDLAEAMKLNPNMNVILFGGYMDLGTPFYSALYEMHQLSIPKKLQANITHRFFKSGHMIYVNPEAHKKLHDAAAEFIRANYEKR